MYKNDAQKDFLNTITIINIKKLERETNKFLYLGMVVAILFHTGLALYFNSKNIEKHTTLFVKSVPVELIAKSSRLTTPFVIKGKKFNKHYVYRKKFSVSEPDGIINSQAVHPKHQLFEDVTVIDTLKTDYRKELSATIDTDFYQPDKYGGIEDSITRIPKKHIMLTEDFIDIDYMDTGQYKALLIHDPNDKLNLKGYVHIPAEIRGSTLRFPKSHLSAIPNLVEAFHNYTGIKMKVDNMVYLDSPQLLKYPFVYISANKTFDFSPLEEEMFMDYLDSGGLALLDDINFNACSSDGHPIVQMLKDTFGERITIKNVPANVYDTLFDVQHHDLDHGIYRENKLYIIVSSCHHDYGLGWANRSPYYFKMGLNIVVYALLNSNKTVQLIDGSTKTNVNSQQWWDWEMHKKYQ